jgi:pimeloyl-ACP methyl ester carboxylesterase/DNA-binding SARP family transcriptional activator
VIGVLGGLRVVGDSGVSREEVPLVLERKARELLTVLALHAPAALPVDELARVLWDDPPTSATKTVRAHLSRIRTALRVAGSEDAVLTVGSASYRLAAETDVQLVQRLRQQARRLVASDPDAAARLLADARAVWSGDPELPGTRAGQALQTGWERERRQLAGEHLESVSLGSHPEAALGELAQATSRDPLDEPGWVAYVVALHRSQRQAEALDAVSRARHALAEVGLDPGSALAAAQAAVFAADAPSPARAATAEAEEPRAPQYTPSGATAYVVLSDTGPDLLVLNPAMVTIDGLLDEPHARRAHEGLGGIARVVCLDRRGVGLSEPLEPDAAPLEQWVSDVESVVSAAGLRRPFVLANFDTGLVALEYAARHPDEVAGLVLVNCFATYQRRADYPYGLDEATTRDLIEGAVDPTRPQPLDTANLVAPSLASDAGFRSWWTRIGRRGAGPGTARTIRTVASRTDLRDRLAEVSVPVLVVHRRQCTNVDPGHSKYLAEHLPRAELRLVDGVDAVWFSQPDDVLDEVIRFLGSATGH